MAGKIGIYIDGFNLYHGIEELRKKQTSSQHNFKWFDIFTFCKDKLEAYDHDIVESFYFTATDHPFHAQAKTDRHEAYIKALRKRGVREVRGTMRPREVKCRSYNGCGMSYDIVEEKMSDVNISVHVMSAIIESRVDHILIVGGDRDQIPTVKAFKKHMPEGKVYSVFPPFRKSKTIESLSQKSWGIGLEDFTNYWLGAQVKDSEDDEYPVLCPAYYV